MKLRYWTVSLSIAISAGFVSFWLYNMQMRLEEVHTYHLIRNQYVPWYIQQYNILPFSLSKFDQFCSEPKYQKYIDYNSLMQAQPSLKVLEQSDQEIVYIVTFRGVTKPGFVFRIIYAYSNDEHKTLEYLIRNKTE